MIRIYYTPVVLLVINKKINFDLSNLVQWLRTNKVDLHVNQIDIVIFWSPRKQITKKWTYVWVVRKLVVRRQPCPKYLGVLLDEQISSHQNKKAWGPFYHKKYFSRRVTTWTEGFFILKWRYVGVLQDEHLLFKDNLQHFKTEIT